MSQPPPNQPILPSDQDADLLFRAQMAAYHYVLGYWKQGVAVIALVLLVALVGGETATHLRDQQRRDSAALSDVGKNMPDPSPLAQYGLAPPYDVTDADTKADLSAVAERYEQLADDAHGLASAEAWFRAGDLWDQLGEADHARADFQKSYDADRGGIYTYAAGNRLVILLRAGGEDASARAILRDLGSSLDGFLAERALLDLMDMMAAAGDPDGVTRTASEFRERFAKSPRLDQVSALEAQAAASKGS